MKSDFKLAFVAVSAMLLGACAGSTTTLTSSNASGIISLVANGVKASGNGMATSATSLSSKGSVSAYLSSSDCDLHGYPTASNSSAQYPGQLTYCFMTKAAGDTILGGFDLARGLACTLEKAGISYDGQPHTVTLTLASSDTECWPNGSPGDGSMSVTVTGSSPASFNTNYDKGVIVQATAIGLVFKLAASVDGNTVKFITNENWTESDGSTDSGATAGTLDTSSGDMRYESRVERYGCGLQDRCGWNRHTRVYSKLVMSNGQPSGVDSISFAYANVDKNKSGDFVTSSGDLTTGIRSRHWSGSASTFADLRDPANWTETSGTGAYCYTTGSDHAATCGSGISIFGGAGEFVQAGNQTSCTSWFGAITGQTFTSVDPSQDVQ